MNNISHESKDIKDTAAYLKEIFYLNAKGEIVLEVWIAYFREEVKPHFSICVHTIYLTSKSLCFGEANKPCRMSLLHENIQLK